jgi:hypothetical protein
MTIWKPPLAHFLVVASGVALATAVWHSQKVNILREQWLQQHGEIDIPEAIYFDGMTASVELPLLALWLILLVVSFMTFCGTKKALGPVSRLAFLAIWLPSSGLAVWGMWHWLVG